MEENRAAFNIAIQPCQAILLQAGFAREVYKQARLTYSVRVTADLRAL